MDLHLVETERLVAELLGRFRHAAFCGMKIRTFAAAAADDDCDIYEFSQWKGEHRTTQGLLLGLITKIELERSYSSKHDDGNW